MRNSLSKYLKEAGIDTVFHEYHYSENKNMRVVEFSKKYIYFAFHCLKGKNDVVFIDENIRGRYGNILSGWRRDIKSTDLVNIGERLKTEWLAVVEKLGGVEGLTKAEMSKYIISNFSRDGFILDEEKTGDKDIQVFPDYPEQLFNSTVIEYRNSMIHISIRFILCYPFPNMQIIQNNREKELVMHLYKGFDICSPFSKNNEAMKLLVEFAYTTNVMQFSE